MQIKQISFNDYKRTVNTINTSGVHTSITNIQNQDSFERANLPSFKGYKVDKQKFNILNQPDSSLTELAEIFHKESDKNIEKACKVRYSNFFIDFFTESGKEKYKIAYKKFMPFVKEAREHAETVNSEIDEIKNQIENNETTKEMTEELEKLLMEKIRLENASKKVDKYFWYEDSVSDSSSSSTDRPMWGPYESDEWQFRM